MKTILLSFLMALGVAHAEATRVLKPLECTLDKSAFQNTVIGEVTPADNDGSHHLEKRFPMVGYPGYTLIGTSFTMLLKDKLVDGVQVRIKTPEQANTVLGDSVLTVTGRSYAELWFDIDGKGVVARCYVK